MKMIDNHQRVTVDLTYREAELLWRELEVEEMSDDHPLKEAYAIPSSFSVKRKFTRLLDEYCNS